MLSQSIIQCSTEAEIREHAMDVLKEKEICEICGKAFKTHAQIDRHMEHMHGNPEKTHTAPHRIE